MVSNLNKPVSESFSEKYDRAHAEQYFAKHRTGLSRRLSHWRDEKIARNALICAGQPGLVLDLPCGAGRFLSLLGEQPNRIILAADNSADMLKVASQHQPAELGDRVQYLQTSAFAIDMPDSSVDTLFCMRLLHHIATARNRRVMLRELHRVCRDTVIISLWVDGNFKAWKRRRLELKRARSGRNGQNQNRFVLAKSVAESEFIETGFSIVKHYDFLPLYAMWRTYVLRKQ
jgi:2-polyprenyl-3-methyl-5-hydroxy-6-metoxy-1,4-benzoquinol methylase